MAYDEEQRRKSRVVVETPAARREVVETRVERVPERRGMSTGAVAALVIGAVAIVTILFLFLMNQQQADNANVRVTTAPTPMQQQPPVIVQQPPPTTTTQPIVVTPPPTTTTQPIVVTPPATTTTTSDSASGTDDLTVQSNIDKKISEDPDLASLGVIATVANGKVTLTGTVDKAEQKRSIEKAVRSVKGVKGVDNRISVSGGAEATTSPE